MDAMEKGGIRIVTEWMRKRERERERKKKIEKSKRKVGQRDRKVMGRRRSMTQGKGGTRQFARRNFRKS